MARPHDYSTLPSHPAVGTHYKRKMSPYGRGTTVVADVTCPKCGTTRSFPLYTLRQQMKRPNFSGACRTCTLKDARVGAQQWQFRSFRGRKKLAPSGYVLLGPNSVDPVDLPLFRAMQTRASTVFEHRFNMARALGRPLKSSELVDHMDGNKQNNDPANLRLYLRGRNQPGSHNGYGTYYHEWQTAEARNRLLMAELSKLRAAIV